MPSLSSYHPTPSYACASLCPHHIAPLPCCCWLCVFQTCRRTPPVPPLHTARPLKACVSCYSLNVSSGCLVPCCCLCPLPLPLPPLRGRCLIAGQLLTLWRWVAGSSSIMSAQLPPLTQVQYGTYMHCEHMYQNKQLVVTIAVCRHRSAECHGTDGIICLWVLGVCAPFPGCLVFPAGSASPATREVMWQGLPH